MIQYVQGLDILEAKTEAIITVVNTTGCLGESLTAQIANIYPDVEIEYKEALNQGYLDIGKVWAIAPQGAPYIVILLPISREKSGQAKIEYIREGMLALNEVIKGHGWKSMAIPKLGSVVDGLKWHDVENEITNTLLKDLDYVDIFIYE